MRPVVVLLVSAGLGASAAEAAEWSVGGFFSERLEYGVGGSGDDGFASVTDLGLSIARRGPRTRLTLAPGLRATLDEDGLDADSLRPRLNASAAFLGALNTVTASASVVPESTDFSEFVLSDEGEADPREQDAIRITTRGGLAWSRELTTRTSLRLSGFVRRRDYTESAEALETSTRAGVDLQLSRQLDAVSSVFVSGGVQRFEADGGTGEDSLSYDLRVGGQSAASPRLEFDASAGLSFIQTLDDEAGRDDQIGVLFNLGASYRPRSDTSVTASAQQSVDQNDAGEIVNRAALRLSVGHSINNRSSLRFATSLSLDNPVFDGGDENDATFVIGPSYSYALTDDWSVRAGFQTRIEDDESTTTDNRVFLVLSRGLTLLP